MRTWNYLYYLTWKLLNIIGYVLIIKPIVWLFSFSPFLSKNWKRGKKDFDRVINGKEDGFNLYFSLNVMNTTTTFFYAILCILSIGQFDSNVDDNLHYYFIGVISMTYVTNYLLLSKSDNYKKYFKEFDKITIRKINYVYAFLFHFVVFFLFILLIYFTVGFHF